MRLRNLTPRQREIAVHIAHLAMVRAAPEFSIVHRVAFTLSFAGHVRQMWQQEWKHEEEARARSLGARSLGGGRDRYQRLGKVSIPLISLLLGLLPYRYRRLVELAQHRRRGEITRH